MDISIMHLPTHKSPHFAKKRKEKGYLSAMEFFWKWTQDEFQKQKTLYRVGMCHCKKSSCHVLHSYVPACGEEISLVI